MASIHKRERSPYWYCAFIHPDGTRAFRSTKKRSRSEALAICVEWERAAKLGRENRLSEDKAREVIADIFARANSSKLPTSTTQQFLESWLARKSLEVAESSFEEYKRVATLFLTFLGKRAERPIDSVSSTDISGWRSDLSKRVSGGTVNKALKILRGAWHQAQRERLTPSNVFASVEFVKERRAQRRAFTLDELRRILDVCTTEWRGLVLFGLYTGQRLGDLASLTWDNIDTGSGELRLVTRKTGRSVPIPLARPLVTLVGTLPAGDTPGAPLFPDLHATMTASGTGTLSRQFSEILASAGMTARKTHRAQGKGRDARRASGGLSFHCLRHTATSLLKNAGVSDVVAMEIIGHDSEAISRAYTHIEKDTLRRAINAMPDVTKKD
jgi:integrase